jgi:tetratricopeptide (TPR) repeat protein
MNSREIHDTLLAAAEHHRSGRLDQAESLYRKILSRDPKNADALHLTGLIAHQRGDHQTAIRLISRAIAISPQTASFHFHFGVVNTAAGYPDKARAAYAKAIALKPDYAEAHNNLGLVCGLQGLINEARSSFETALKLRPDFVDAILNLGNLHKSQGELEEAFTWYTRALAINPNCAGAYNNLGNLMLRQGKLEEAVEYYRRSLALNPNDVDPTNNLGGALMRLGRHEEALRYFDQALTLAPDHAGTHLNKAWLLLLRGEFEAGWREYEWRLKLEGHTGALFRLLESRNRPAWDGSPPQGRSILVYCEQGLGDTIQFVRYLPLLKERGARVIFCCQKELVALMAHAPGIDVLLVEPAESGITEPFDCHVPLLSLPRLLSPEPAKIPAVVPYLRLDAEAADQWKSNLNHSGFKVGIVWAGRPSNAEDWRRSCRLADFSPLAGLSGVRFFSLQKGPAASEAATPPPGMDLVDLNPELQDFKDTAAVVMNLDLVVAVDTAVAHLAGALGRPIWTVLPHFPDWRWQLGREDSCWYRTMRIFRQPRPGDWRSVFDRVAAELSLSVRGTSGTGGSTAEP